MKKLLLVTGLVLMMMVAMGGVASADAGSPASCMAHEVSSISPPGSSEEFPGGARELKAFIDWAFPGVPPGKIFSFIASLHEGSHEACDEVLEG